MDKNLIKLQFDTCLEFVSEYCMSSVAKGRLMNMHLESDLSLVQQSLDDTEHAYKYISVAHNPIKKYNDIALALKKIKVGALCQCAELYDILLVLQSFDSASKGIKGSLVWAGEISPLVHKLSDASDLSVLMTTLSRSVSSDSLLDKASEKLASIRRAIIIENNRLQSKLQGLMGSNKYSAYLQDNIVTTRQGRYVLPVKVEHRGSVDGLLHDQSSTGSTVYVEPLEIFESNNKLKSLQSDQEAEVLIVLRALSNTVSQYHEQLSALFEILVDLDCIFAKAEYSLHTNSVRPSVNDNGIVDLKDARHPLLDKTTVVPISVHVGGSQPILVVSGPNTGGKTVSLKVLGLCCAMASVGVFVPCKEATVSTYDSIFCLIGDGQSIEQSLSTFSAHISSLVEILDSATTRSLVLLDELGSGTDPQEGAALALGVIKYLQDLKCTCVITSHYHQLKQYATTHDDILNASMQFDTVSLKPTYKLAMNIPGASFALHIASNLGVHQSIIDTAYSNLNDDSISFEQLLLHMQSEMAILDDKSKKLLDLTVQAESEYQQAVFEKEKYEQKHNELKARSQKLGEQLIADAKEKAEEIIEKIKQKLQKSDEKALFDARTYKNQLDKITFDKNLKDETPITPLVEAPIKGQKVLLINLNSVGVVKQVLSNNKFAIQLGNLVINSELSNLADPQDAFDIAKKQRHNKHNKYNDTHNNNSRNKNTSCDNNSSDDDSIRYVELMLIGQKVFDAILSVDEFVQQCLYDGNKHIRLVHGKGSGALGRGIQQHLQAQSYTKKYRYGRYGEGDSGVTILELK